MLFNFCTVCIFANWMTPRGIAKSHHYHKTNKDYRYLFKKPLYRYFVSNYSPSCIVPYVAGVGEGKEQIPYYKGFSALDRHLFTQLWLLLVTTKVWPAENPYLGWLACCWCPRPPPGTRRWRTAAGTAAATSFSSLSHPHVCGGRWCAFRPLHLQNRDISQP